MSAEAVCRAHGVIVAVLVATAAIVLGPVISGSPARSEPAHPDAVVAASAPVAQVNGSATLSVTVSADTTRVPVGGRSTITVDVDNTGQQAATNVEIAAELPDGFVHHSSQPAAAVEGLTARWLSPRLDAGERISISFAVRAITTGTITGRISVDATDVEAVTAAQVISAINSGLVPIVGEPVAAPQEPEPELPQTGLTADRIAIWALAALVGGSLLVEWSHRLPSMSTLSTATGAAPAVPGRTRSPVDIVPGLLATRTPHSTVGPDEVRAALARRNLFGPFGPSV